MGVSQRRFLTSERKVRTIKDAEGVRSNILAQLCKTGLGSKSKLHSAINLLRRFTNVPKSDGKGDQL